MKDDSNQFVNVKQHEQIYLPLNTIFLIKAKHNFLKY